MSHTPGWVTCDGNGMCPLHAAAPDLLAALRPFVAMLDEMPRGADGTHIPCSVAMRDLIAAREAIAKAEGSS
jgi:hypothetical protein